ncbi:unnamed protein product [Diamesa serratosioi]
MEILKVLLIIAFAISANCQEDIVICTGNVHGEINFKSLLHNKVGNLKETTEVSDEGFFVLPIYDKGEYKIQIFGPPGLSFAPEFIELNFDGQTDICSLKKDINFVFKGFGITGKVNIFNGDGMPGVSVELFKEKDNKAISKTTTSISGEFQFSPVKPGSYFIRASSSKSWHFTKSEVNVNVREGNTAIPENSFIVSGFNLDGRVKSDSEIEIGFLIYNLKQQQSAYVCDQKVPTGVPQQLVNLYELEPIGYSLSSSGTFSFINVSKGKYLIIPYIDKRRNQNSEIDISPPYMEVSIDKSNLKIEQEFEINGFSVSGKILLSPLNKQSVEASIKVNGKFWADTTNDGSYTLKNLKEGSYNIQVLPKNTDYQYQDRVVKISLTNPIIPEMYVSAIKVCGKVVSKRAEKIAIKKIGSTFFSEAESVPSRDGEFCLYLANGKYTLEVLIDETDKKSGLQFYPLQQFIEVNSTKVEDIVFSQLLARVQGLISCLDDCNTVEVTLQPLNENDDKTSLALKTLVKKGAYSFENILPGRIQISVSRGNICWENDQQFITVKSTNEAVPTFNQKGYNIKVISSHRTKASYKLISTGTDEHVKENLIELSNGYNDLCVPQSGDYIMKLSGCHSFDDNEKLFSTNDVTPLNIVAVFHRNGIRILSEMESTFTIQAVKEDGTKKILKPEPESQKVDGYFAYKLELNLKADEKVMLIPFSDQMLFKPNSIELKGHNDCIDVASNIIATKGLVVSGKTEPEIDETFITLSFPKNPEMKPLTTTTNKKGEFRFPTIDPTIDNQLKAEKESYIFSSFDVVRNVFTAHKLCEIVVEVKDDSGNLLSNVLLSLSGGDNYRNNLVTGTNGLIKFHSLLPSKSSRYYLRAMMKEYKFEPNFQSIEIQDGETKNILLVGKRVAYSVFGQIKTLSGDPLQNALVEAISTSEACSNHQEEGLSEFNGEYRIRGLQSNCDYKIRLGFNHGVKRTMPQEKEIVVKADDTLNVNFVAISQTKVSDVIIKISSKSIENYKTLKMQLFKKESSDTPVYSQRIENLLMSKSKSVNSVIVFLPRISAAEFEKKYLIELTTTLSDKSYNYKLPNIEFIANGSLYFEIDFLPTPISSESELNINTIAALCLIFTVGFIFFKQDLFLELVSNFTARLKTESVSLKQTRKSDNFIDEREIEKLADTINSMKKKKQKN